MRFRVLEVEGYFKFHKSSIGLKKPNVIFLLIGNIFQQSVDLFFLYTWLASVVCSAHHETTLNQYCVSLSCLKWNQGLTVSLCPFGQFPLCTVSSMVIP